MGQYSKVETDGRLMIITINRPEVYNACHPMANQELVEAFDEFGAKLVMKAPNSSFSQHVEMVKSPAELGVAISRGISRGGPTLIDCPVGPLPDPWALVALPRARPRRS